MRATLLILLSVLAYHAPTASAAAPLRDGLAFAANVSPVPVRSGATRRLAYEIHLTNYATTSLTLERLDVLDASASARPLASWSGAALQSLVMLAGAKRDEAATLSVPRGRSAIAYLDLELPADGSLPKALTHRLSYRGSESEALTLIDGAAIDIATEAPVVIGPPLRGSDWVALYDPAMARGHRRVAFAIDGSLRIPARFAIDWMRIDADGRLSHGDEQVLEHWPGYGADVLGVADATVVAMRDSIAEPQRLDDTRKHPLEDASGNYISLDLGRGRYVHYEHLKPGSVRVHVGQRVRRGEVIARLGFTGDSTGPHLHMHVSNGATPLAGEGLPFAFDAFEQVGAYASMNALGKPWTPSTPDTRSRHRELPAAGAVLRFDPQP